MVFSRSLSSFSCEPMSNTFERSIWRSRVRSEGFFLLKPVEMAWLKWLMLVVTDKLNIFVRYSMSYWPRCFRCRVDILSGPRAFEGLDFLIATFVCLAV